MYTNDQTAESTDIVQYVGEPDYDPKDINSQLAKKKADDEIATGRVEYERIFDDENIKF